MNNRERGTRVLSRFDPLQTQYLWISSKNSLVERRTLLQELFSIFSDPERSWEKLSSSLKEENNNYNKFTRRENINEFFMNGLWFAGCNVNQSTN